MLSRCLLSCLNKRGADREIGGGVITSYSIHYTKLYDEALTGVAIDCLGGLEIGAISIATTISDYCFGTVPRRDWRTFVVRKQAKDHGLGKLIEGAIRPGDQALIVV